MFPWMDDELRQRRRAGLYRTRRRPASAQGAHLRLEGRTLLSFASNDYLGLAADPRLARAAARAARRYGCGAGASALVVGHLAPLRALERDLARWQGSEDALVFSSGYLTNLALVSTLAGRHDAVFSDQANHASLIDGCRLARAAAHVYRHADLGHLGQLLRAHGPGARRRLILSDSVFSMDGDLAPLEGLLRLAEEHDALLLLDEAHATGVLGPAGRGLSGLLPPDAVGRGRLIKVGTLSKALGAQGGFVCGSRTLVRWLVNHARPYIFTTALAPPVAAAARRAVRLVQEEPWRGEQLLARAAGLRGLLRGLGYDTGMSACHIVPVIVGRPEDAVALSRRLEAAGLLVPAIRPPSVPEGTSRLRISLCADHSDQDVAALVAALGEVRPGADAPGHGSSTPGASST